jgi:hypothetical protein
MKEYIFKFTRLNITQHGLPEYISWNSSKNSIPANLRTMACAIFDATNFKWVKKPTFEGTDVLDMINLNTIPVDLDFIAEKFYPSNRSWVHERWGEPNIIDKVWIDELY